MKSFFIIFAVVLMSAISVGAVYVVIYGWPQFFVEEKLTLQGIADNIVSNEQSYWGSSEEFNIYVSQNANLVFEKKSEDTQESNDNMKMVFTLKDTVISTAIDTTYIYEEYASEAISAVFNAIANKKGFDNNEAIYSLILDATKGKTVEKDGYSYSKLENTYNFSIDMDAELKLVDKSEIYIKPEDIIHKKDILVSKLRYDETVKPGIVLEKVVTHRDIITLFIYENKELTNRAYNSMLTVLQTLMPNQTVINDIKENYPTITQKGKIVIDNVEICLNEGLSDDCIHYYLYDMLQYKYMKITFRLQDVNI